jgi:hypothetical protein
VPVEAQRLERRLGRRDRLIIATILTATGITTAGSIFVHGHNPQRGSATCITYDEAGVMGGGTWHLCGADAVRFCNQQPKPSVATQCISLLRLRQTADP